MWGIGRFNDMADFVAQGKAMGFCCIELNHQVTADLLDQIMSVHRRGQVIISSVHDPCPNAAAKLELLAKVSDLAEESRAAAVAKVKRSIDLAYETHARAVVLHVGDVWELHEHALELRRLFQAGRRRTAEYELSLARFKQGMTELQQPHLDAVARSLQELIPYAQERGLQLGIENRYYVNEIPTLEQACWLFDRLDDSVVGYWHDVGHAEVQDRLGFAPHEDWLRTLGRRIIGIHLHDVLQGTITDHQSAGLGDLDLPMVLRHLPAAALRVCEFDKKNTEEQVRGGLQRLAALGFFPNGR